MTPASQFSLEEENFYKDIQDLVKKGSENEKQLSTFLQRYMDLLARADLDDETFIINFTKAALILEASAKVYGTKVDRLWINLEQVLEALKVKGNNQNKKKGDNEEDVEEVEGEVQADDAEPLKKLPNPRKKKKLGEGLTSPDDFLEIDNISGLLGKNMNEENAGNDIKIKFHEEIPNLFIRNKSDRRRIDVCLVQSADDRDDSRLRDWVVSAENMLVKDIYIAQYLDGSEIPISVIDGNFSVMRGNIFELNSAVHSDNEMNGDTTPEPENLDVGTEHLQTDNVPDDSNNNVENVPDAALQEQSLQQVENEKHMSTENRDKIIEALNRSQEVDVGKFPNVFLRRLEDCLVDVNEVFWNPTKFQDVIPSRKMRIKKTNKVPCLSCSRRTGHLKKGKRCHMFSKNPCLDMYFSPLAQPGIPESPFGVLPDEELYNIYKVEMKLVERLGKIDKNKNMYEAYHPDDNDDEEENFLGFDGVENRLMRNRPTYEADNASNIDAEADLDGGTENIEPLEPEGDIELPLPATENSVRLSEALSADICSLPPDPVSEMSGLEYQDIITGELRNQEAAKSQFEKSKELGKKIANWHSSLIPKIAESQKRGAFNVDLLAGKILEKFPQCSPGGKPVISFRSLVEGQLRRDISRYFFACLQLTNERNIDIFKSSNVPLATDCMMIRQLRSTRVRHELDEYTNSTSPKKVDKSRSSTSLNTPYKRKRNSDSVSSSDSFNGEPQKKATNCRNQATRKRRLSSENKTTKKRKENVES